MVYVCCSLALLSPLLFCSAALTSPHACPHTLCAFAFDFTRLGSALKRKCNGHQATHFIKVSARTLRRMSDTVNAKQTAQYTVCCGIRRYTVHGTGYWALCCSVFAVAVVPLFLWLFLIFFGACTSIYGVAGFFPPPQLSFCFCNEQSWKLLLFSAYGCTRAPKHTRALENGRRERRGVRETSRGLKRRRRKHLKMSQGVAQVCGEYPLADI